MILRADVSPWPDWFPYDVAKVRPYLWRIKLWLWLVLWPYVPFLPGSVPELQQDTLSPAAHLSVRFLVAVNLQSQWRHIDRCYNYFQTTGWQGEIVNQTELCTAEEFPLGSPKTVYSAMQCSKPNTIKLKSRTGFCYKHTVIGQFIGAMGGYINYFNFDKEFTTGQKL